MLLKNYYNLLMQLKNSDWKISGIACFLREATSRTILLRHDVDRRIHKAIQMALLENKLGIKSTYYFRTNSKGQFPEEAIKNISSLGHEVGYHYETLAESNGNFDIAIKKFESNLKNFRLIAPCETISMHGSPLSKYNNQELVNKLNLSRYGLLGDAVSNISQYAPMYFTDVGGRWNHNSANLKDIIPGSRIPLYTDLNIVNVDGLLKNDLGPIYISTHPERWSVGLVDKLYCVSLDFIVNFIKRLLRILFSFSKNKYF